MKYRKMTHGAAAAVNIDFAAIAELTEPEKQARDDRALCNIPHTV
jgi:hypothetical protein